MSAFESLFLLFISNYFTFESYVLVNHSDSKEVFGIALVNAKLIHDDHRNSESDLNDFELVLFDAAKARFKCFDLIPRMDTESTTEDLYRIVSDAKSDVEIEL